MVPTQGFEKRTTLRSGGFGRVMKSRLPLRADDLRHTLSDLNRYQSAHIFYKVLVNTEKSFAKHP